MWFKCPPLEQLLWPERQGILIVQLWDRVQPALGIVSWTSHPSVIWGIAGIAFYVHPSEAPSLDHSNFPGPQGLFFQSS